MTRENLEIILEACVEYATYNYITIEIMKDEIHFTKLNNNKGYNTTLINFVDKCFGVFFKKEFYIIEEFEDSIEVYFLIIEETGTKT